MSFQAKTIALYFGCVVCTFSLELPANRFKLTALGDNVALSVKAKNR